MKLPGNWQARIPADEQISVIALNLECPAKPERIFQWFNDREIFDCRYAYSYRPMPGYNRALPCHQNYLCEYLRLWSLAGLIVAYCPGGFNTTVTDVIYCTIKLWRYWLQFNPGIDAMRIPQDHYLIRRGEPVAVAL